MFCHCHLLLKKGIIYLAQKVSRSNFSQPFSCIALVYHSRTIADELFYDWIAEKSLAGGPSTFILFRMRLTLVFLFHLFLCLGEIRAASYFGSWLQNNRNNNYKKNDHSWTADERTEVSFYSRPSLMERISARFALAQERQFGLAFLFAVRINILYVKLARSVKSKNKFCS